MASTPPICDFGWKARDFRLPATDGKSYGLADLRGPKGTLIVFICNHCPYVKAITGLLVRDAADLAKSGIGVAAICANDAVSHPEDSFANMKIFAKASGFAFPYLHDESQEVAKAYGAICTPDFFGFNAKDELQYRGRLDASRTSPVAGARRDLYEAMMEVARTGKGPKEQISSMGCSIKWKAG
ncbi:thioredoxin family protein [Taklimakanibacter lacteus]|uniref:thioredoxin family protein n=1 Tax=Taklimakanibacter lacteus TaxID=2268456 RepID=UPI000E66BA4C